VVVFGLLVHGIFMGLWYFGFWFHWLLVHGILWVYVFFPVVVICCWLVSVAVGI
jgi:hypothetical protein